MNITPEIHKIFLNLLDKSIEQKLEMGSFGLYVPKTDSIIHAIEYDKLPADFIKSQSQVHNSIKENYKNQIRDFNNRKLKSIHIGNEEYKIKDGFIIGYHAHPSEEDNMVASKEDANHMLLINSPVEIVLSAIAKKYNEFWPMVANYKEEFFSKDKVNFSELNDMNKLKSYSKQHGVKAEQMYQLISLYHNTKLHADINFNLIK